MQISSSVLDLIGNTPLLKLRRASEETGCTILGKCEFMNPGQSVKDRAALGIVEAAETSGALRPGGTIVEGTAGNTGIGLCMVGKAKGYRVKIVIPRTQSQEKKDAIRLLGGELIEVDAVPYADPNNYVHYSRRLAEETENAVWANQFDNTANRDAHYKTTGPEIWEQTDGKIDGFTCAVGSGGTLGGVALALKERSKDVRIALTDPYGAKLFTWVKSGTLETEGNSIMEGIGQGRVTENLKDLEIDEAYRATDAEALEILFALTEEEGLCLGGSAGINIAGAKKLARDLGPGSTVVTVLCDYGNRYQSKLYNPQWLREKGLPVPRWLDQ
ncbi:cysteine synthase A [Parvularcula oceani]|uniref:cysteine synthase A n=1 Tax=Parvularcula oceani TaxID=1247963 RepID=UPI0004E1D73B